ncbi:MAG TPA: DUF92 domain-containing protein [Agriterribacter sp.]|nr:DUF92 domain-containing protein [Agriterribacter sp.]
MYLSFIAGVALIITGMVISTWKQKLTPSAAVTGAALALLIFVGTGFGGLCLLASFFVLGVTATSWQLNRKIKSGLAENELGKRNARQVVANAGVPAILALLAILGMGDVAVLQLMIAASFSAAAADTVSSELGNIYGSRYYDILSLRKSVRGANGAVSWQGTIAGIIGSTFVAFVYCACAGWSLKKLLLIIVAGTIGNIADSILGTTLENKRILGNNAVNFLNTAIAALATFILYRM